MNEIDPLELGRQLRKPTGEIGLEVGENMNISNREIYNFVLSALEIRDNSSILEIGFGNGKFLSKYFDINPNIHLSAVDFSELMCFEAEKSNRELVAAKRLVIKCEDSGKMSFSEETFDIVVAINTVYFWDDIECNFRSINKVLKKKGRLVIAFRPKNEIANLSFAQEVFRLYNSEDLQFLLQQNGFRIIKEEKQLVSRKSANGSDVRLTDVCLVAEKI